jgi:hypothetical protein
MDPAAIERATAETLEALRKAESAGILVSTGIQGVDLSGLVAQVPVNVPARNNTSAFPRVIAGEGSQTATWRALLNINSKQTDAAVGFDYAGTLASVDEQDCFAPYRVLAKGGRVTLDAVAVARNFADALAADELQTLNQLFIAQDLHIINSQGWSLGTSAELGKPTLVQKATGGTVGEEEIEVKFVARSGADYFTVEKEASPKAGGSLVSEGKILKVTEGAGAASVTASVKAVKGAVAYDWYVGKKAGKLYYYTTTTVASVLITKVPTGAEPLPTTLPLLSSATPYASTEAKEAATTKDTSYSENWYNGVIASILGDYGTTGPVTPGKGTSSGATFIDYGGKALEGAGASVYLLDEINDQLWASTQQTPTAYMVNSLQADEISKLILDGTGATTFLPPTDADARTNLAGGGYIGRYINKAAGGVPVQIEVHPRVAPGTIIARTDRVPYPGSNIGSVYEVRCQYDTMRFDYAANRGTSIGEGPRYDYEIRSVETLINRAPAAQAVACNIA